VRAPLEREEPVALIFGVDLQSLHERASRMIEDDFRLVANLRQAIDELLKGGEIASSDAIRTGIGFAIDCSNRSLNYTRAPIWDFSAKKAPTSESAGVQ
jgi:hypothetical protein